ncbi:hypothetical protein T492DRAFT_1033041 [Pavlovales sp. CCMP2436]|nr:hypothetical protein T492DRAFT_1033041 [Pavlovales sp. CCMP2436]
MSIWDTLDRKTRSPKKIKTTSLVDAVPSARDALLKETARTASSALARVSGSLEEQRANNALRVRNHRSTGRDEERVASDVARGLRAASDKAYMDSKGNARRRARRHLKGDARRAAVTALSVHKFDNLAAAPLPYFLSGPDSFSFFKSSRELIALVRAYAGYKKFAAASSSAASEGDDDLDDEDAQEPEGENDHLPEYEPPLGQRRAAHDQDPTRARMPQPHHRCLSAPPSELSSRHHSPRGD